VLPTDGAGSFCASGPATRVLLLGVGDVLETKRFYREQGLDVAKSFGRKYVDFATPSSAVKLALYGRRAAAKDAGVSPDGSGSHRVVIACDPGSFTDPDGFAWTALDSDITRTSESADVGDCGSLRRSA
jgi:hypothetical protein